MILSLNPNRVVTRYFLLALFASVLSIGVRAAEIPVEDFVKHGDYLDLKLSPDGKHMAGRIRRNDGISLLIFNMASSELVGGVNAPENREIHSITWANNERIVFEISEKFNWMRDRPVSTCELYGVNIDGSKSRLLYGFRAGDAETGRRVKTKTDTRAWQEVISVLKNDPKHILIAEYPWVTKSIPVVSKLNIYSGVKKKVERIPYHQANILADERDGSIRFISWWDKNNVLHAAKRESDDDEWQEVSFKPDFGRRAKPVQINKQNTKVYWRVDLGVQRLSSLREVDLSTNSSKVLFSSDRVDISFWESDFDTNEPVVGVFSPGEREYQYADGDSAMKTAHRQMVKAFPGQKIYITSYSDDGSKLLLRVKSDTNPGEFYLFNRATKKVDFLWANRSWIDPREMQPMQNLDIPARDGQPIHALLTMPKHIEGKPPALIVIPHGGPHGIRDYWGYDNETQLLANRGYAVLQVNFRGSGGFGRTFRRQGYKQWGGLMIDDIIDVTKAVAQSGNIDPAKVCVYGASYGGYAAMMAAAKAPSLFKCTVGYVGVYDLNVMYSHSDIPDYWGGKEYLKQVIGDDEEVLRQSSPTTMASKITADVMLIHGMEDRRAPVKHARNMRKAFKKVGKDVEWLTYGGSGHGVYEVEKRVDMYQKLLAFLESSLSDD